MKKIISLLTMSGAVTGLAHSQGPAPGDWPSYNRSITSERFSQLAEINTQNVAGMKVLCTYDTKQNTGFQTGLIMVDGALIGTTEKDIFSINPATCAENWRTAEDYKPANVLGVNRGAAYMDGRLFRGTQDGRVLAYDFKTGKQLWATAIADPELHETVPAAPIAWNGMVFIGQAGGDFKGVKGRMYALDAKTGKIIWETYLVPKTDGDPTRGPSAAPLPKALATWKNKAGVPITGGATWTSYTLDPETGLLYVPGGNPAPDFALGPRGGENLYSGSMVVLDAKSGAYSNHYKIVPQDYHDWDVSAAPSIIRTKAGKKVLSVAPKDGFLYGFDLATNAQLYRVPVTRIYNVEAPFSRTKPTRFCPGAQGGVEWNGPAYDPKNNLVLTGAIDWCATVIMQSDAQMDAVKPGGFWAGMDTNNPVDTFGKFDPHSEWAGWLYATNADTGKWKWRMKTNYPILSGVTPTAGGIVLFGDMGGNFYALDVANGKKLWHQNFGGALGGGVITYSAQGAQKVAIATGMTSVLWPTKVETAKVVVLGVPAAVR